MGSGEIFPLNPLSEVIQDVCRGGVTSRGYLEPDAIEALRSLGYRVEEVCNCHGEVVSYRVLLNGLKSVPIR